MQVCCKANDTPCFLTGKPATRHYLTVGTRQLFNTSLPSPYTAMNIGSNLITQITLFNQICCLENLALITVAISPGSKAALSQNVRLLMAATVHRPSQCAAQHHSAAPDTVRNRKCCILLLLFLNIRCSLLPTEASEVSAPRASVFLQNHSQLRELDFKLLKTQI